MVSGADQQVVVELIAKPEKLKKGFQQAGQATKKFSGGIKALKVGLVAAAAAITAAIVVTKKLMKTFTEHALKIDKINKVTGMSCESLQRWGYVVEQEHGNFETLTKSFTILAQRMVDADQGLETYTREFRAMGVELRDEQGNLRDVNDVFMDMGDYAKNATNQTEAMGHMGKILGSRYVKDLLPVLKLTREQTKQLGDEAERLGIVLDTKTIRAAKAFDDKMTKLKNRMKGVGLQIVEKMLPAFEKIIDAFDDSELGVSGLADSIGSLANSLADFVSGEGENFLAFLRESIVGISVIMDYLAGKPTGKKAMVAELAEMTLEELIPLREIAKTKIIGIEAELETLAGKGGLRDVARRKALKSILKIQKDILVTIRETERERRKTPLLIEGLVGVSLPEKEKGEEEKEEAAGGAVSEEGKLLRRLMGLEPGGEAKTPYLETLTGGLKEATDGVKVFTGEINMWEASFGLAESAINSLTGSMLEWGSVGAQVGNILTQSLGKLTTEIFEPLRMTIDATAGAFKKFFANIYNALVDLVSKILIQGLAFAGIITALNLIPPPGTIGTALAKFLAGGSEGGMHVGSLLGRLFGGGKGFDSAINDLWARRQGTDFARNFQAGLQNTLQPAFAGGGMPARTIVVRLPDPVGALAEVYEETEPHSQQRFGRATRKATGKDKEAD